MEHILDNKKTPGKKKKIIKQKELKKNCNQFQNILIIHILGANINNNSYYKVIWVCFKCKVKINVVLISLCKNVNLHKWYKIKKKTK